MLFLNNKFFIFLKLILSVNNYLYQEGTINKEEMSNTFKSKNKINVIHMLIIPIINPAFPMLSFCLKLNHPNIIENIPNITEITINRKNITDRIEKTSDVIPNPLPYCISLFSSTLKSPPTCVIIA